MINIIAYTYDVFVELIIWNHPYHYIIYVDKFENYVAVLG